MLYHIINAAVGGFVSLVIPVIKQDVETMGRVRRFYEIIIGSHSTNQSRGADHLLRKKRKPAVAFRMTRLLSSIDSRRKWK